MKLGQIKNNGVWEKKENDFEKNYPYCSSCSLSETFCQCKGHNQALAELSEVELVVDEDSLSYEIADHFTKEYIPMTYKQCEKLSKALSSSMGEWLRLEGEQIRGKTNEKTL